MVKKRPPRGKKRGKRETPEREVFRGGDPSAPRALARGLDAVNEAVDLMVRFAISLGGESGPPVAAVAEAGVERAARALIAEARRRRRVAAGELQAARRLFRVTLGNVDDARAARWATRRFEWAYDGARRSITLYHKVAVEAVGRMRFWALRTLQEAPAPAPVAPLNAVDVEVVWTDNQVHRIGEAEITTVKFKFNLNVLGVRLNFCVVQFRPPGEMFGLSGPKLLIPTAAITAGGRTTVALDSPAPEVGNIVVPRVGRRAALRFYGYIKVIYVTDVPADCVVLFQSVVTGRGFILVNKRWVNITGNAKPGEAAADPPGGILGSDVGGGMRVFGDLPNTPIPSRSPVCTYLVREELFRTWVVEFCPNAAPNILGYWEWGFSLVLHKTANGVVSVPTPDAPAGPTDLPGDIPEPPAGGWPKAPSSGPTRWVAAGDAPQRATTDHRRLFPESYLK